MIATQPAAAETAPQTRVQERAGISWLSRLAHPWVRLSMLVVAGLFLVLSLLLPYWTITLHAPQYPQGLTVDVYAWKLTGDVAEVDGLNHYIGMMKLEDAASLERSISRIAIPLLALLAIASFWVRGRWVWLAVAPVLAFPVIFMADLFYWLRHAGHNLDPTAALSSSIKPFTPRILGEGVIGQFSTIASFGTGFYLVILGVLLVLAATILRRWSHAPES
jgi:hypothetical protein